MKNYNTNLALLIICLLVSITFMVAEKWYLSTYLSRITSSIEQSAKLNSDKQALLLKLTQNFGYDGFIHHFKNYVLRRDRKDLIQAASDMSMAQSAIKQLLELPLSKEQKNDVKTLKQTYDQYKKKLDIIGHETNVTHMSIEELDALLKVDDHEASLHLKNLFYSIENEKKQNTLAIKNKLFMIKKNLDKFNLLHQLLLAFSCILIVIYYLNINKLRKIIDCILQSIPSALLVTNKKGKLLIYNSKLKEMFGYSDYELNQFTIENLAPQGILKKHKKLRSHFLNSASKQFHKNVGGNIFGINKQGDEIPLSIHLSSFTANSNRYAIAIIEDQRLFNSYVSLAENDHLTSIYNRRKMDVILKEQFELYLRYKNHLAVIIMDIDFFKKINDKYGHDAGDNVLIVISKYLKGRIRATDFVARWGGEEFLILCPKTNLKNAKKCAESIREGIAELKTSCGTITASFGVAESVHHEAMTYGMLIKQADLALYAAKESGRNCIR